MLNQFWGVDINTLQQLLVQHLEPVACKWLLKKQLKGHDYSYCLKENCRFVQEMDFQSKIKVRTLILMLYVAFFLMAGVPSDRSLQESNSVPQPQGKENLCWYYKDNDDNDKNNQRYYWEILKNLEVFKQWEFWALQMC